MKYLLPFLLLIFVPSIVYSPQTFLKGIQATYKVFFFVMIYMFSFPVGLSSITSFVFADIVWWWPAVIDSFSVIFPVCVVIAKLRKNNIYLLLMLGFFILTVFSAVRTGLISIGFSLGAMLLFKYKAKAVLPLIIAFSIVVSSIIWITPIREKMFHKHLTPQELVDHYDMLTLDDINSSGRFAMWAMLLNRLYEPNKLMGSGLGIQQKFMYQFREDNHFSVAGIAHNDYVQMLCDTGQIGLVLYLTSALSLIISSFKMFNNRKLSVECRYAAFIAGTSLTGLLAAMITDNVVNYTMVTLAYPFTFYGIAKGLENGRNEYA